MLSISFQPTQSASCIPLLRRLNRLLDLHSLSLELLRLALNLRRVGVACWEWLVKNIVVRQDDLVDNLSQLLLLFPDLELLGGRCNELVACNHDL